jgi:hypothetical protein
MSRVGFQGGAAGRRRGASGYIAVTRSLRLAWRPDATLSRSLLRERLEWELRARERSHRSEADPTTALRETVEAIWKIVEQAARESALDGPRHDIDAVLARRELVRCGTRALSAVVRRGVESGAFRPACAPWAIRRLPFALVAGACAHWVFGLAPRPALRPRATVQAALAVLRPGPER